MYFFLPPLPGTQRFTREQICFECRQYDHIKAHIHEQPLLTPPRTSTTAADHLTTLAASEQCHDWDDPASTSIFGFGFFNKQVQEIWLMENEDGKNS